MSKFCVNCGKKLEDEFACCPECGTFCDGKNHSQSANQPSTTTTANKATNKDELEKWIVVLLCFFLGGVGAHKFYEGKIGMGILYIFTCGLFGIGCLIDFIILLKNALKS